MADVKARVINGVVNDAIAGTEITLSGEDFESLQKRGFVERAPEKTSTPKKPSRPAAKRAE